MSEDKAKKTGNDEIDGCKIRGRGDRDGSRTNPTGCVKTKFSLKKKEISLYQIFLFDVRNVLEI
jgi:hypothetical protein